MNMESIGITQREREVLKMLSLDHTYKDLADIMYISLDTVKSHRKNLGRKLSVKTTAGLIRKGIELGLIKIN